MKTLEYPTAGLAGRWKQIDLEQALFFGVGPPDRVSREGGQYAFLFTSLGAVVRASESGLFGAARELPFCRATDALLQALADDGVTVIVDPFMSANGFRYATLNLLVHVEAPSSGGGPN